MGGKEGSSGRTPKKRTQPIPQEREGKDEPARCRLDFDTDIVNDTPSTVCDDVDGGGHECCPKALVKAASEDAQLNIIKIKAPPTPQLLVFIKTLKYDVLRFLWPFFHLLLHPTLPVLAPALNCVASAVVFPDFGETS